MMTKLTNRSRNTTLLTLSLATALSQAAPEVYSNFDLNYNIGTFLPEFRFSSEAAPLDITLPAFSQAPLDFIGSIPENAIAWQFTAAQTSDSLGWYAIGGDTAFPSNVSIIDGDIRTVHIHAKPTTAVDFQAPKEFAQGDVVGPGQDTSPLSFVCITQTLEGNFLPYWLFPQRFIVGVEIELIDGKHYGFVEFEDTDSMSTIHRSYTPVRWGYETTPDTPFAIPTDCGRADIDRNGTINFFDISLFVTAYTDNRYAADLDGDGVLNFRDVSAFISEYGFGCP